MCVLSKNIFVAQFKEFNWEVSTLSELPIHSDIVYSIDLILLLSHPLNQISVRNFMQSKNVKFVLKVIRIVWYGTGAQRINIGNSTQKNNMHKILSQKTHFTFSFPSMFDDSPLPPHTKKGNKNMKNINLKHFVVLFIARKKYIVCVCGPLSGLFWQRK